MALSLLRHFLALAAGVAASRARYSFTQPNRRLRSASSRITRRETTVMPGE